VTRSRRRSGGLLGFAGRRLLAAIPVVLGATFLVYLMVFLLPGDPVRALFGTKPADPARVAALRAQFHLDEPFFAQYWHYLQGVIRFDFGTTFAGRPVGELMAQRFPVTIQLAFLTVALEALIGIGFGVVAGLRRGGWFDATALILSLIVLALPTFVLGIVARFVFGTTLGWVTPTVGSDVRIGTLILPALVLGALSFAYVLRLTRTAVAETLSAEHVLTARARGLPERRVIGVHVLRNSLIPVVTFLGADLGNLMLGAVVTEGVFNIPGIGNLLFESIGTGESTTVVSVVTVLVVVFVLTNLLVDLLYALLDPRIRHA
jgi:oligopeptide transport system permease protein